MRLTVACVALAALVTACGDTIPRTQVMLVIDAEPGVRSQTTDVQIVVRGGTGAMAQWQERLDRSLTLGDGAEWPMEVSLTPLGGDSSRVYEATATAMTANGDRVAVVRAISGYRDGKTLMLRLLFEDDCRDQVAVCGATQTCRAGACVDANVGVASLETFKPGAEIDASVDADGTDASAEDAHVSNDGGDDAGPLDASADATVSVPLGQECERCDMRNSVIGLRGQTVGTCGDDLWCTASYRCFGYCECGYNMSTGRYDLCDNSQCATDRHCVVNPNDGYVVADGLVPNHPSGNVAWTKYGVCTLAVNDSYSLAFNTCTAVIP